MNEVKKEEKKRERKINIYIKRKIRTNSQISSRRPIKRWRIRDKGEKEKNRKRERDKEEEK